MRAAQRRSRRKRTGKGDGCQIQLLNCMRGCIAAAENDAANPGLLHELEQKLAECNAK